MNVDLTSVFDSPTPLYSLPSIVTNKVTIVFFLFLSNGPNEIPVDGASILSINTETGLPSSHIVLLTDNISSVICLTPNVNLYGLTPSISPLFLTSLTV